MTFYATTYRYVEDSDATRDEHRPAHRAFLGELADQGKLLIAGPYVGGQPSALLIFEADSADEALALTDEDPFVLVGVVAEVTTREWTPATGRLAAHL